MPRCDVHCPGGSAGMASAAIITAGAGIFAVAGFAAQYAVVLIPGMAGVGLVTFGLYRVALRLTVPLWRGERSPLAIGQAEAPRAVEARTAPLAIEAPAPVVYRITDVQQRSARR